MSMFTEVCRACERVKGCVITVKGKCHNYPKPRCFENCDCGDVPEEHCSNREFPVPNKCTHCDYYFGNIERGIKPSKVRDKFEVSNIFNIIK